MSRYFLTLSYNGKDYNGWQAQNNTPNTIQQVLEEKLQLVLKQKIELVGCGRTDTGVSAKNYIAHFDYDLENLIDKKEYWLHKFNTILPETISTDNLQKVSAEAHARFDAVNRTYHYFIHQQKNPFIENYSYYFYGDIDFDLMNVAAKELYNYIDFTSFSKLHAQTKTNNCKITKAVWEEIENKQWRFTITADRFLRGMVRAVVGTLLMVGKNKITINDFKKIIESKNRQNAGNNAPAHALILTAINYPIELFSE
jgi:tRNA pseudouridine38-40 synthase